LPPTLTCPRPSLQLIKHIGKGAYGVVVSCRDTSTGTKVAVKKVARAFDDLVDAKRTLREIKLLRHLVRGLPLPPLLLPPLLLPPLLLPLLAESCCCCCCCCCCCY